MTNEEATAARGKQLWFRFTSESGSARPLGRVVGCESFPDEGPVIFRLGDGSIVVTSDEELAAGVYSLRDAET